MVAACQINFGLTGRNKEEKKVAHVFVPAFIVPSEELVVKAFIDVPYTFRATPNL